MSKKFKKKAFPCHFFPSIFYFVPRVFLAVSLHDELKNTTKTLSKIIPENLQKPPKK
jgi:hypothetical protein